MKAGANLDSERARTEDGFVHGCARVVRHEARTCYSSSVMAQPSVTRRFLIQLSHVDAGVYQHLDLRVAQHPSETLRYLLTRLLAFCYLTRDDVQSELTFSKGGLSSSDEPAISRSSLDGRLLQWCEIGNPSAERVHKASKAAPEVFIFTHHNPELLQKELASAYVHRKNSLQVFSLSGDFLDELAQTLQDRTTELELTLTEGTLYVSIQGNTLTGALKPIEL